MNRPAIDPATLTTMKQFRRGLLLAALSVVVVACAASGEPGDEATGATDGDEATRPPFGTMPPLDSTSPIPSGEIGSVPDQAWNAILEDLSRRIGRDLTDPTVVAAGPVTFSDGSLGCPQPGQMYTQALVDGYRVIVEVDGEEYDFRIGASANDVRLCESGSTLRDDDNS